MDIASIKPNGSSFFQPSPVGQDQAAQRRQLRQAIRSVNQSGRLGQNELVFSIDHETRRPVIRVEDRDTHEVVLQVPPEYVLNLAEHLNTT